MSEFEPLGRFLSRTAASAAVTSLGWRYVLGVAQATVQAGSLAEAARSAAEIAAQCREPASGRLFIDIRDGYLILTVQNPHGNLAKPEVELIRQVSAIVLGLGLTMAPQRNRIHVDISVPHDEASARLDAALKAGGALMSDASAPAFWVWPTLRATRRASPPGRAGTTKPAARL